MPQTSSQYTSKLITANPVVDADPPKLSRHEKFIFRLNWQPVWQADFYRVYRDNEPWIETAVTDFFDNPPRPNGTYVVEARRDGRKIWQSQPVPYQVPRVALKEAPELHAVVRAAGVLLLWPAEPSPYVSRYELYRRTEGQANWEMLADMPALRKGENRFFDYAQPGTWRYRLVAVSAAGEKSNARQIQVRISGEPASPVVDLPLHEAPEGLHVTGKISFTAQGAHFVDGYFDIPYREKFNADQGMTVEFEVAFDQVDPMTVPLCHGWYSADGWFFQILDGRLTLCHPVRNLKSDTIEPGRWYKVRWIYDGVAMRLWVDDYCVDHTLQPIRIVSSKKPIRVGQYVSPAPSFSFKGTMRNLKMYRDVLPN